MMVSSKRDISPASKGITIRVIRNVKVISPVVKAVISPATSNVRAAINPVISNTTSNLRLLVSKTLMPKMVTQ